MSFGVLAPIHKSRQTVEALLIVKFTTTHASAAQVFRRLKDLMDL